MKFTYIDCPKTSGRRSMFFKRFVFFFFISSETMKLYCFSLIFLFLTCSMTRLFVGQIGVRDQTELLLHLMIEIRECLILALLFFLFPCNDFISVALLTVCRFSFKICLEPRRIRMGTDPCYTQAKPRCTLCAVESKRYESTMFFSYGFQILLLVV